MACRTINKICNVLRTLKDCPLDRKYFTQKGNRLQICWFGLQNNRRKTAKKRSRDHTMACKTVNKIGMVLKTLGDYSLYLLWPKILYPKGDRLQICWPGLQNTGERLQKSGQGPHAMACKTINKIWMVSKTLIDCPLDLPGPKRLHPEGDRLQICWPGLQNTAVKDACKKKQPSPSRRPTNPKCNIVDTFCHASCMIGHGAM